MLSELQKKFCDNYIETGNATQSYIDAGYKAREGVARANSSRLLTKANVKKYIEERLKILDNDKIADQKEVMEYLTQVLRGEVKEEVVVTEGEGEGFSRARIMSKQVSAKDRNKAAELIGKRYAMWTDNKNVDASFAVTIIDDIEDDDDGDD